MRKKKKEKSARQAKQFPKRHEEVMIHTYTINNNDHNSMR